MIEDALEVATDPDYRFELAIQLGRLAVAKVSLYYLPLRSFISMTCQYVVTQFLYFDRTLL